MVTSNVATVSTGGTLIFTATVAGTGGPPVGTVAWTGVTCTLTTPLSLGVASCSITPALASTAYTATATFTDTDTVFSDSFGSDGPVSPSLGTQAPLSITSISGTFNSPLTLTTSGGSGTGAVTYVVDGGTATGCGISSGALLSTSIGTCIVTATKAADGNYLVAMSAATTITIGQAPQPTPPTITNLPTQGTYGGGFVAVVGNTIGGGVTSVTSNTPAVCTATGVSVSYVGVGTCSLTAQIATSTNYLAATGSAQTFSVGRAQATTPTITNLPTGAVEFAGFTADIGTTGDGTTTVVSSTPSVCKVESRRADRPVHHHGCLHAHVQRRDRAPITWAPPAAPRRSRSARHLGDIGSSGPTAASSRSVLPFSTVLWEESHCSVRWWASRPH